MKELKLNYYFKHIEELSEKNIFENCDYVYEPLIKLEDYINSKIVEKRTKINKAKTGEFCSISGYHYIDEETKIGSNVTIEGPVIIGKNVVIQPGALIRPYTIIGDDVVVGHCCELKHCIIQNKAKVQSFTFCGDSIIGKSSRIGSGTILANRRFDQKQIPIKINGNKYDTGLEFFGAIIGDNTRLGANSTSTPGTLIGPYCYIFPTVQVRNFVEEAKKVIKKEEYIVCDNEKIELE